MCAIAGEVKLPSSLLNTAGTLFCWGNNEHQQSHLETGADLNVKVVKAGDWHTCAINKASNLGCWGLNTNGQTDIPDQYKTNITNLAVKNQSTCLLIENYVNCLGEMSF